MNGEVKTRQINRPAGRRTCSSQINLRSSFRYSVFSEPSIIFEGRMDCQGHNQNPPTLSVGSADQWPFGFILCHPNHIISPAGAQLGQHQLAYQLIQQQQQQLQQQLQAFWANQYQEIGKVTDFKNHSLPLARIKKIMKADEDVRMVLTVFGTKLHL